MASQRYLDLANRLADLRKTMLPRTFSKTGSYSAETLDRARGYRLLAHAEMESYIEDRVRYIANQNVAAWLGDGKARRVLLNLLAFYLKQEEIVSHKELRDEYAGSAKKCEGSIKRAVHSFNEMISNNHGVKEKNILRLLLPLGLAKTDIDNTWLVTLDTFGTKRGEVAHTSIRTQQPPDPKTERNTVKIILTGLRSVDQKLERLLK
jgi:HEPN superfamily RiboL-PSP-like protein